MRGKLGIGLVAIVLLSIATGQDAKQAVDWKPLSWLIGDWIGSGAGAPGQGTGSFSFQPDLQGKILVRKSFAEYPATAQKPAYRHDDLMIVFAEGGSYNAIYFDNEEHTIRYSVDASAENAVTFLSDAMAGAPRFRLTYRKTGDTTLSGKFEIAPPDKPFATYLEWSAQKKATK